MKFSPLFAPIARAEDLDSKSPETFTVPFPTPQRLGAGLTFLVFAFWMLLFFQTQPVLIGDHAFFVLVAERLVTGDRLYVDIWDNKEPLFFYILATGRLVSPLSGWLLEFSWFSVAAIASYAISIRLRMSVRRAVLTAGVGVPLVMAGSYYWAGSSHTPGVALALVTVGFLQANRTFLAGLCLGVLPFLKVLVFPTAALMVIAMVALTWESKRVFRLVFGFSVAALAVVSLLWLRGEWSGFQQYITYNSNYSTQVVGGTSLQESVIEHLNQVMTSHILLAMSVAVLVLTFTLVIFTRSGGGMRDITPIAMSTVAGFGGAILTLAFTAQWDHHAMVLAIPLALTLILFAALMPLGDGYAAFGMITLVAYLLAGVPALDRIVPRLEYARADIWLHLTPPDIGLEEVNAPNRTFARVGGGDINGIGPLLRDWNLACPYVAQYRWDPPDQLQEVLECLKDADVIYVSRREFDATPHPSSFNDFRLSVQGLLDSRTNCQDVEGGQLCTQIKRD